MTICISTTLIIYQIMTNYLCRRTSWENHPIGCSPYYIIPIGRWVKVMYRLKPVIIAILILVVVMSSTIVMATNMNPNNKAIKLPHGYHSALKYDEKNGYEELFKGRKLEYFGFIHYRYTEITGDSKHTNYTDANFDFYLTIKSISEDSVTYSGEISITGIYSDDPSDKEYVMKLANMYNFDALTKKIGYPVISITDYIDGFLEDTDLHVEKWESKADLIELSTEDYTTVVSSYKFNIGGNVDISGAENAYFILTGYAHYHDYLSIPVDFHVEATIVAETDNQKVIIKQETHFELKSKDLRGLIEKSNVPLEHYSIGGSIVTIRITAKNVEMHEEKSEENVIVLSVKGEGIGFMGIEVDKPASIERILVDDTEKEYITLFEGEKHTIIILPLSLSDHIVKIYFKGVKIQEQKTTTSQTTIEQEITQTTTTQEFKEKEMKTTTTTEENKMLLYIIAGGFIILIVLMIIVLVVVLLYRKK